MLFEILLFLSLPILLVIALLFKNKNILIILLVLSSYLGFLGSINIGGTIITQFHFFLGLALFVFVYHLITNSLSDFIYTGLELEWLLLFSLIFFSLIYSANRLVGIVYAFRFSILILMIYIILNLLPNQKTLKYVVFGILFAGIALAIASILSGFTAENIMINYLLRGSTIAGRSEVNIDDPNIFATQFILPIIFSSALILTDKVPVKLRWLAIASLPILLAGLAATFSRSAWVAIAFGFFLLSLYKKKIQIYFWITFLFIFIIFVFPDAQFLVDNLFRRVINIFAGSEDTSSSLRVLLLGATLQMIIDSYMLGIGFHAFPIHFTKYYQPFETTGVVESHNLFGTVFAELGLVGFLLVVWIFIKILKLAYINYRNCSDGLNGAINISLFLSLISYLFFYQFYGGAFLDNNIWILISMIFYIYRIYDKGSAGLIEK